MPASTPNAAYLRKALAPFVQFLEEYQYRYGVRLDDEIIARYAMATDANWQKAANLTVGMLRRVREIFRALEASALGYTPQPPAQAQGNGLCCYSCGRPYSKGPDLVISDKNWAKIAPKEGGGGVLCPNCMNDAFEALGAPYGSIEAAFTSGPFANKTWKKPSTDGPVSRPPTQAQGDLSKWARAIALNWAHLPTRGQYSELIDRIEALEAAAAQQSQREAALTELRIVFDGPPSHQSGRFVEVETPKGKSVNAGEWHERTDGLWELRLNGLFFVSGSSGPVPSTGGRQAARGGGEVAEKALGTSPTFPSEREAALVKALEAIEQRANESGTGPLAYQETVFAMHDIARKARVAPAVTSEPNAPHDDAEEREAALVKAARHLRAATDGRIPPHSVSEQDALNGMLCAIGAYDTPAVTSEPNAPHDGRAKVLPCIHGLFDCGICMTTQPRGADLADAEDRSIGMTAKAIGEGEAGS